MKLLKRFFMSLIDIVFPPCCLICGKQGYKLWCNECKSRINKKITFKLELIDNKNYYFKKHLYIFVYKDEIRNLILDYKFNDKSYLYKIFSEIIVKNKKIFGILEKYDIIIPVPIHKKRRKQRGYNQTELIAKEISKNIQIKYEKNCLIKYINTEQQSKLNREQRKQNLKNAYKITNKEKIQNRKIILFDDIYTTGSTANECCKILKQNGAQEILVFTIAKD